MPVAVLKHSLEDVNAERARRRLHPFVEQAWPILEPDRAFVDGWHIGALAEHLEAVTAGEIMRLLVNIPPGCMKSLLLVCWCAWEWQKRPGLRYLCGSYSDTLTIRDQLRVRDIVTSEWYRRYFNVQLRDDQNAKTRMDTTAGGWRIATSVGGRATGEHPDRVIVDDPHNAKKANSEKDRESVIEWNDRTLSTRGASRNAAFVYVMQRLAQGDLSGHILGKAKEIGWVHICLPMRYERPRPPSDQPDADPVPRMEETPIGFQDPRTEPGELLWPALFDDHMVDTLELDLGPVGTAGQLQQRPAPLEGNLFKRSWFQIVDALPSDRMKPVRSWDGAATEDDGDYTAGVKMSTDASGRVYIEHMIRERLGPHDIEGEHGIIKQTASLDGKLTAIREEQEPGSAGKKLVASHATLLKGYDYQGNPSTGDKVTRAMPFRAQCAVGNVFLVRGAWNHAFIEEFCLFPNGDYDDQVDATSGGYDHIAFGKVKAKGGAWGRKR